MPLVVTAVTAGTPAHVPILALLILAHLVVDAYATMVPALLPFWQARFGLTYGLAGLITGIANVTSSVAQPLVGIVAERGRDTRWLALACAVAAIGICATGLATSFPLFLLLVVVGGLGVSAFHPQGYKLTGLYAGTRPAVATSWFLVGGNVGVAIGPLLGTAAVLRFGPPGTAFLVVPGLALVAALLWLMPRWTRAAAGPADGSLFDQSGGPLGDGAVRTAAHAAHRPASRSDANPAPPPGVAGLSLRRRTGAIGVLVLLVILRSSVSGALTSFVPLYFVRIAGSGEAFASRVLAGMLLAGALATIAGGYLADRLGRVRVLAATLALTPPLLLLFLAAPAGGLLSVAALWGAGAMLTASFSITVVLAQELWYERRALASGVIVGFAFGLGGLFVPIIGLVADRAGLTVALQLVAGFPLAAVALAALLAALLRPPTGTSAPLAAAH